MSLRNVAVSYSRRAGMFRQRLFWALNDVSFDLYHGETLGILGRNGAGKSTLLRLLAGITDPERGTLRRDGSRVSLLSLQAGFVPYLTGMENAILGGILLGKHRAEMKARLPAIFEFAELQDFAAQPLGTYSAGMRARLGFAVAFEVDPDILLIDEVLGVGDTEFRRKSTQVMKERIKSDRTVVLVSHQVDVLRELCDRLVLIREGVTEMEGDVESVLARYAGRSLGR